MKKILLLLLLPFTGIGQTVLEHTYIGTPNLVTFTDHGDKYSVPDLPNSVIRLYDINHSLWKTVTVPAAPAYHKLISVGLLSDKLVNSDGLIEYYATFLDTISPNYVSKIYNENGTQELSMNFTYGYYPYMLSDGSYKLVSMPVQGQLSSVYGVPGALPCVSCASLKAGSTQKRQPFISEPTPNPSTGSFVVNYAIEDDGVLNVYNQNGQIVKAVPVFKSQNAANVELSLPAGVYYFNVQSGTSVSETKKLITK